MERNRKLFRVVAVLAVLLAGSFALVGCAKKSDKIVIAACMQGNQSGFVRYMVSGMYEYQKASAPDIEFKVVYADDDPAKQQSQVEQFVSEGVNAIILNPVDKVQSAVIGHSAQVLREQAYKQVLAKHPEAVLVVQNTADWSGEKALVLVENWIQTYRKGDDPGIDLIATHADCILVGAITAVENAGLAGKILLGGMDCDMPVMEKIRSGVVDNSIWQDGLGQGEWALRLAIDAAQGKSISDHIIPYEVCTKDNVDSYIQQAQARNALSAKYF